MGKFCEALRSIHSDDLVAGFHNSSCAHKSSLTQRILEVDCGSGIHTLYFAKTMLKRGGVIVSTDISEEMIKMAKNWFEDPKNDYIVILGNKS